MPCLTALSNSMNHGPTDAELIIAIRAHDSRAQGLLLDRWVPEVIAWCARLGGTRVDAEDAAQDVFIVVITRLHSLRNPDHFKPWLFGITRRVLAKHRRRVWLQRWVGDVPLTTPCSSSNPEEAAEQLRRAAKVHSALGGLPLAQREVLVLCDLEGRSATEAATLLDVPVGTVKSRLRLGRRRFRDQVEDLVPATVGGGA
ncbi:MAG: RNA polymerase sigma factor (sigma-70 family) [Kiritimatiellia bacterium]|jgi:RNA polymerase sigma factor (sigma-70 family)